MVLSNTERKENPIGRFNVNNAGLTIPGLRNHLSLSQSQLSQRFHDDDQVLQ